MTSSQASAIFRRSQFVGRTDSYITITPNTLITRQLDLALQGQGVADVSGSLLTDPYVQDAVSRLGRYKEFMDFYAGRHHTVEYDGGDRKPVCNFPRRIVNKRATWITGRKGFQFVARRGNEAVCDVLDAVWKANRKKVLLRRTAKVALTCGDAFLYVTVKTKGPGGRVLPKEKWTIRICPINPSYVFPIWTEDDPNVMRGCMLQFPIWSPDTRRTQLFSAVYTADKVEMYTDNTLQSTEKNVLGMIPIVHIPNESYGDMPFGISALQDVKNPVQKFNEVLMQISKIVKYHADPTTIVYGTSLAKMEKAASKVWSNLPPPDQARVENLEMRGDLGATYKLLEHYRDEIHTAAKTPQIAYEARELATSNSSGLAIQLLFQPLIEVTDEAQDEFSEAVTRVNRIIAAIFENVFGSPLSALADDPADYLSADLLWPSMLPRDVQTEVDLVNKMLEMKIISKAEAARRLSGITDTERAAIEIAADSAAELAIDAEKAKALNGQNVNFAAVTLGSLFVNEDLLDIAKQIGDISGDEEKETGDTPDEPDAE